MVFKVHTTDFPGNYPGFDDTWNMAKFKKVTFGGGVVAVIEAFSLSEGEVSATKLVREGTCAHSGMKA